MKSVGEILQNARRKKNLTLGDVHKFIKIHPKYIKALEAGEYSIFSDKVHAKGFLKLYADLLDLNVEQLLAFWRREYEVGFEKRESQDIKVFGLKSLETSKFAITPVLLFGVLAAILIFGFFGYLFFQYKNYSGVPKLEIYTPKNSIVVTTDILDVTGKTEGDSVLFINNQNVILNTDGSFVTTIRLHEGLNSLNFKSINKLGKESDEVRTIIYRSKEEIKEVVESTESTRSADDL